MPATITATILGLAAQIEREFISARTKEALERRKAAGLPVGRPKGRATKLMLDDRRAQIVDYLNKGVSKRSVAKILGCSPTTLYSWIRRRRISGRYRSTPLAYISVPLLLRPQFEAESVAFLVCNRLGIENPSPEYLSGYVKDHKNTPPISLDCVLKSAGLIEQMGQGRLGLRKEKGV